MAIEIKDIAIMDCEIGATDGSKTYIPSESMIEHENTKFNVDLEKKLVDIGSVPCECFKPIISPITQQIQMPTQEELVNSYEYGAIVLTQADIRTDTKCVIRRCKNCGKVSLFGEMDYFLGSLSLMLSSVHDAMDAEEIEPEIIEEPIDVPDESVAEESEDNNA